MRWVAIARKKMATIHHHVNVRSRISPAVGRCFHSITRQTNEKNSKSPSSGSITASILTSCL